MKKTLLKILVLVVSAALALGICVTQNGGTLNLYYEIPPEATELTLTFVPEGIVEAGGDAVTYDFENSRCKIALKALAQGDTVLNLHWDKVEESGFYAQDLENPLTVLPENVILDRVTLNFSGWSGLVLTIEAFLFVLAGILFYEYLQEKKNHGLYSYRRIRLLGFALFFLVLALLRISDAVDLIVHEDSGTVWSVLIGLSFSARQFMVRTAPLVIVFAVGLCVSNTVLLMKEGIYPVNFLGIAIGAVMAGGALFGMEMNESRISFTGSNEILNVYAGLFVYFECHLAATINCALQASLHVPDYDKDYVMILGCRVRPDGTLYPLIRGRVDRAVAFRDKQLEKTGKAPVLVPSGGKGSDEKISEADAMAAYLRSKNIPEDQILVENRSATTRENMLFSRKLIDAGQQESQPAKVAFSTSNYHVFRGGILANANGWEIDGMGSKTIWYYWPNAFLREFIGLMANSWLSQSIVVALIIAVSIALVRLI